MTTHFKLFITSCLVIYSLVFLFEFSNCSDLIISQSCKEASDHDPNLSYDFCYSSLEAISSKRQPPPNSLEDLVAMSIRLTKSNGTTIILNISNLLKSRPEFDRYVKACLQDCLDLYRDSLSALEDATAAFESKDLDTAGVHLSTALDYSVTCEDQFKDKKGVASPITKENQVYFQLNVISLAFTQMCRLRV